MDEPNKKSDGGFYAVVALMFIAFVLFWLYMWTPPARAATYDIPPISSDWNAVTLDEPDGSGILANFPCYMFQCKNFVMSVEETPEESEPTEYFDLPLSYDLQDYIFELCEEYDVDPRIVFAVIQQESRCTANIKGDRGRSLGLMQIQPKWHSGRMNKLGCSDLLNPYQNVAVGIDYISELYHYGGRNRSTEWVLMAYNGGPGYANKKAAVGEVSGYAKSVLKIARNLDIVYA